MRVKVRYSVGITGICKCADRECYVDTTISEVRYGVIIAGVRKCKWKCGTALGLKGFASVGFTCNFCQDRFSQVLLALEHL